MPVVMNDFLDDFRTTLESASERLLEIPEAETEVALADGWCAKQVLGHLIDSAANNHIRFVRAQLRDDLVFEGYEQEGWVRVQKYEQEAWVSLVDLWTNYNLHLLNVITNMSDEDLTKTRVKNSLPADAPAAGQLEYLVRDYLDHLKNHVNQIFNGVTALNVNLDEGK